MITNERLDANWRAISLELDAPPVPRIERALRSLRVPAHVTRLVVATPSLRRAWFLALGLVALVGFTLQPTADNTSSPLLFLMIAPLAPLLGVALAYGPNADPAYEAHLATPTRGLRLLAIRSTTVVVIAAVLLTLVALTNEVSRPWAGAWLLPSIALTTSSLAAMTRLAPRTATMSVTVVWVAVVLITRAAADSDLAAFRPVGQILAAAVIGASTALAYFRRDSFDRLSMAT